MFAQGVNSGLPVIADPGDQGIGSLVAGATELSNTDIGRNLMRQFPRHQHRAGTARRVAQFETVKDVPRFGLIRI
jgi:flagellar hook protein FlgE